MYFPIGWPKVLRDISSQNSCLKQIISNRDKILFAALTENDVTVWFCKPCVPIVNHKRTGESLAKLGQNVCVEWKPDSSMLCIATSEGHLLLYNVSVADQTSAYNQYDPPNSSLRRNSAELFIKEIIPALTLNFYKEVLIWDGEITRMSCISGTEIMICTTKAHLLRYRWDGSQNRDYSLDLRRTPFCINQQVSKAEPIDEANTYVNDIEYSPLVGGFGITLNDGRAAFLTATTLKFDPNQVQGIWAQGIDDATCASVNHKYRLIAFGRKNSQVGVFTIDETTGGLDLSHTLVLSSKDFPGDPGPVNCMRWSGDGRAIAVSWRCGGVSVWSTFGSLLMCSLAWHHRLTYNPLQITSMEWSTEGYQLWMVKNEPDGKTSLIQLDFVKSPLAVNPCTSNQRHLYLQADDRFYLNVEDSITKPSRSQNQTFAEQFNDSSSVSEFDEINMRCDQSGETYDVSDGKQWIVLPLPSTYIATNWPLRFSCIDESGTNIAAAGRTGFVHYNTTTRKWKLFGNESQERELVVCGGMLWWRDHILLGCYNISGACNEIRIYPRESKLDNAAARVVRVQAHILSVDTVLDQLVVFCADALVTIYQLSVGESGVEAVCIQAVQVSALCVHPACVASCSLCALHPSYNAEQQPMSLILNVSGRLMMIQREESDVEDENNAAYKCLPATVLASCVESIWCGGTAANPLARALWLWCGAYGARVWLPLMSPYKHAQTDRHSFIAKRIMLPFQLKIYPLTILFEDAILMGAENDTTLYATDATTIFAMPFCIVNRTSQVYLHQILRQLLRRNLGYHAWEIANSCSDLPYFPHSLELLLHEVLEEEATSKEPIPDAQLPSIIEFVQEFAVYLQTVVQCARKTEIALWDYLFSAAGKPKELFQKCLQRRMLNTAASYLIILQNLESSSVSRGLATQLLDTALQHEKWDLARDLVRFLRAIDPSDVDSPRNSMNVQAKYPTVGQQQSAVTPNAEDLSVILGTMQLQGTSKAMRHRSVSIQEDENKVPAHAMTATVKRKKSLPSARHDVTPARYDVINAPVRYDVTGTVVTHDELAIFKRRLSSFTSTGRAKALGKAANALQIPLLRILRDQSLPDIAPRNATNAFKALNNDFGLPHTNIPISDNPSLSAEFDSQCGDSGYTSLQFGHNIPIATAEESVTDCVSVADACSVWGGDDFNMLQSNSTNTFPTRRKSKDNNLSRSKAQLRYVCTLCIEAHRPVLAALCALALCDATSLAAASRCALQQQHSLKGQLNSPSAACLLRDALTNIARWVYNLCLHCAAYKPMMTMINEQIAFLNAAIETEERQKLLLRKALETSQKQSNENKVLDSSKQIERKESQTLQVVDKGSSTNRDDGLKQNEQAGCIIS